MNAFFILSNYNQSLTDTYVNGAVDSSILMDITIHVDDGKVTSDSEKDIDELMMDLKKQFVHLKVQDGNVFEYVDDLKKKSFQRQHCS